MRKALLAAALLSLPVLLQAQVKLLRHPTYSKGKVAFSYLGDIWIANENGSGVSASPTMLRAISSPASRPMAR